MRLTVNDERRHNKPRNIANMYSAYFPFFCGRLRGRTTFITFFYDPLNPRIVAINCSVKLSRVGCEKGKARINLWEKHNLDYSIRCEGEHLLWREKIVYI